MDRRLSKLYPTAMYRTLRAISLIVLAVVLGAPAGFAQSSSAGSATSESSRATVQHDREHGQKDHQRRTGEASTLSRRELESMMLGNVGATRRTDLNADLRRGVGLQRGGLEQNVALEGGTFQLAGLPLGSRRPQEAEGNRRIYYIVGGALVAGGLVAGVLALTGDGGEPGIPRPPGRPSQ